VLLLLLLLLLHGAMKAPRLHCLPPVIRLLHVQ
jgi:hypothetical protein